MPARPSAASDRVREPVNRQMTIMEASPSMTDPSAQPSSDTEPARIPAVRPRTPSPVIQTREVQDSSRARRAVRRQPSDRADGAVSQQLSGWMALGCAAGRCWWAGSSHQWVPSSWTLCPAVPSWKVLCSTVEVPDQAGLHPCRPGAPRAGSGRSSRAGPRPPQDQPDHGQGGDRVGTGEAGGEDDDPGSDGAEKPVQVTRGPDTNAEDPAKAPRG